MNKVLIGVWVFVLFVIAAALIELRVDPWLYGLAIIILALASTLVLMALGQQLSCPRCNTPLPKIRTPKSARQFLRGGWTCPNCGAELNYQARLPHS